MQPSRDISRLIEIMAALRGPGTGCGWDIANPFETIVLILPCFIRENEGERRMSRADASGLRVAAADIPIIIGMVNRGDRRHDIAAWFGLNQGRIKDTQDGKYGPPHTTPGLALPPKGPPGIKERRLREAIDSALAHLSSGDTTGGISALQKAIGDYDADEA